MPEETLFYRGYGQAQVDPVALAYYRYERIVQDIAVFCERIFSATGKDAERRRCFDHLAANFAPGGVLDIACRSDKSL